jgi:lysozyme
VITNIFDQLDRDEEVRLKPYDDATGKELRPGDVLQGKISIGTGRNLSDVGLSPSEERLLRQNDIARAAFALSTHLPWSDQLSDARRGVLLNMTFNLGIERLLEFHVFLGQVESGDYEAASHSMLQSLWARQVGQRAQRLSLQMQSDQWQ